MSIKVSIVEDDAVIRSSLAQLIGGSPGFRCVSHHGSAEEALRDLPGQNPDVVLMDIHLPAMSGIACVQQLKKLMPAAQIIMLTVYEDDEGIFRSLSAGASGYMLKRTPPAKLLEAIEEVHRGGSPMSSHVARKVVQTFQAVPIQKSDPAWQISPREQEILSYLSKGFRYKEIADTLSISIETVRTHLRRIYEKLQVHSRTEAVIKYLERG